MFGPEELPEHLVRTQIAPRLHTRSNIAELSKTCKRFENLIDDGEIARRVLCAEFRLHEHLLPFVEAECVSQNYTSIPPLWEHANSAAVWWKWSYALGWTPWLGQLADLMKKHSDLVGDQFTAAALLDRSTAAQLEPDRTAHIYAVIHPRIVELHRQRKCTCPLQLQRAWHPHPFTNF